MLGYNAWAQLMVLDDLSRFVFLRAIDSYITPIVANNIVCNLPGHIGTLQMGLEAILCSLLGHPVQISGGVAFPSISPNMGQYLYICLCIKY